MQLLIIFWWNMNLVKVLYKSFGHFCAISAEILLICVEYLSGFPCRCKDAPLDVTRCIFMRDFAVNVLPQSHWTETLLYKRKENFIHSLSLLFITEERLGSLWKKRWFIGCKKERRERNRRLECFLSALSLPSSCHLFTSQGKKLPSLWGGNFFPLSNLRTLSLPLTFSTPRGNLLNLEWGPHNVCVFSSDTEGESDGADRCRGEEAEEGHKREKVWEKRFVDGNDVSG